MRTALVLQAASTATLGSLNEEAHAQVWNASKLSAAQEIAHGSLQLPLREQAGDARVVRCVKMTPAPRVKGPVWGGELTLELQYARRVSSPMHAY